MKYRVTRATGEQHEVESELGIDAVRSQFEPTADVQPVSTAPAVEVVEEAPKKPARRKADHQEENDK